MEGLNFGSQEVKMIDRSNISLSGVNKIVSFDDEEFLMETTVGNLQLLGEGLELLKLDTNDGNVKIKGKIINAQDVSRLDETFSWTASQFEDGEYVSVLDRFDAMVFEWLNFKSDPILGYSRNTEHSFFRQHISNNFGLANGLVCILGMYGLFLGFYFFYLLFVSSVKFSMQSYEKKKAGLLLVLCLSAISYSILSVPVFTTFWFYGVFNKNISKQSL